MSKSNSASVLICTLTGFIVLAARFVDLPTIKLAGDTINGWTVIISAFALGLGAVNVVRLHWGRIKAKRVRHWWLSYVTLVFFAVPLIMGLAKGTGSPAYEWSYNFVYSPLSASIVGLGIFWLVSASYRAFRIRNLHSALLLGAAVITMVGSAGLGKKYIPMSAEVYDWILTVPTSAILRSLSMLSAVGMAVVSLRILVGLERRPLGGGDSNG